MFGVTKTKDLGMENVSGIIFKGWVLKFDDLEGRQISSFIEVYLAKKIIYI
jgi:hypothetical protein